MSRKLGSLTLACCALLHTHVASASAPAGWVVGLERVLGFGYTMVHVSAGGDEQDFTQTHFGSAMLAAYGYSIPRLTLDHVWQGGLSVGFGSAFFYSSSDESGDDVSLTSVLLEGRVGYYLDLGRRVALWPKLGVALRSADPSVGATRSHTALALQLPLVFRDEAQRLWPVITPHLDLGLGGGYDDVDQRVTEVGLSVGLQLW
jgi:hypothetical protein